MLVGAIMLAGTGCMPRAAPSHDALVLLKVRILRSGPPDFGADPADHTRFGVRLEAWEHYPGVMPEVQLLGVESMSIPMSGGDVEAGRIEGRSVWLQVGAADPHGRHPVAFELRDDSGVGDPAVRYAVSGSSVRQITFAPMEPTDVMVVVHANVLLVN